MTNRRQKGEGSISRLPNGKIRIRIELEPQDGKRQWLSAVADTKTEAIKKLNALKVQREQDKQQAKTAPHCFSYYINSYLTSRRAEGIRESTIQSLKYNLTSAGRLFGTIPVNKLTHDNADQFMIALRQSKLCVASFNLKVSKVKAMFDWLVDRDIVSDNIFKRFKGIRNKGVSSKKKLVVLSECEHDKLKSLMYIYWRRFLDEHKRGKKYRMYPLYLLGYETGMRAGELAGLMWSCVDFDNSCIHVENNITVISDGQGDSCRDGDLKTDAGYRDIVVSKATLDVLRELKEAYNKLNWKTEYVFASNVKLDRPYSPAHFTETLRVFLGMVGITRRFTFHDIRHTNASVMMSNKVEPLLIAERLGHSDASVSFSVYGHILQENEDRHKPLVVA